MGHKAKWEYFRVAYDRYHNAGRGAKQLMLNEFCLHNGYHRKYARKSSVHTRDNLDQAMVCS